VCLAHPCADPSVNRQHQSRWYRRGGIQPVPAAGSLKTVRCMGVPTPRPVLIQLFRAASRPPVLVIGNFSQNFSGILDLFFRVCRVWSPCQENSRGAYSYV